MLQLKEKAHESLSRLTQVKAQAEESLSSLTLMADNLKSLVNKQKILLESTPEFQKRKIEAKKFLAIERLPVIKFKPKAPVSGERKWHCLIKEVEELTNITDAQVNDHPCNHQRMILNSDDSFNESTLANLSIDVSRFSIFSPRLRSSQSQTEHEASESSICSINKSLLTDQSAVFADSAYL